MRRGLAIALSVLVAAAVPAILLGTTLLVLLNPWFVHTQYALPGFPDDQQGLDRPERSELAVTGIRSVRPGGEGVVLLEEARLPSGDPAFEQREIRHMEDVRGVIAGFLAAWAIALIVLATAGLALWRSAEPGVLERALSGGAVLALVLIALAGLLLLVSFDTFFEGFHGIFFEGDSWRFNSGYTLRRLYPDFFWGTAGGVVALLVALQSGALVACVRRWGRRPPSAATAGASLES